MYCSTITNLVTEDLKTRFYPVKYYFYTYRFIGKAFYLKSKLRTENEQMSVPLPQMPVNVPPMNPVTTRTMACQTPKLGMES